MPPGQLHKAIHDHLGDGWREKLVSFDEEPLAAASIGQVHKAVFQKATGENVDVCMKIQYPGVVGTTNYSRHDIHHIT
jgi:aarF domain-containing kinase